MPSFPGINKFPAEYDDYVSLIETRNLASAQLSLPLANNGLSIRIDQPAEFSPTGLVTLTDSLDMPTREEIVGYTSIVGSDLIVPNTGFRGLQNTTAQSWLAGHYIEQRHTQRHRDVFIDAFLAVQGKLGLGASIQTRIFRTAGEALGGHRAVRVNSSELAFYASRLDAQADVLGVTLGAVSGGGQAEIVTFGEVVEPSWAWSPNVPVWLDVNGLLTQSPPAVGALIEMGVALAATKILVRVHAATFL